MLLLVVTLAAIGLGIWSNRARRQRRAVKIIQDRGGSAQYGPAKVSLPGSAWLRDRMGIDFFERVEVAQFVGDSFTDDDLEHLHGLSNLEGLALLCTNVTDAGLTHVEGLHHLRDLQLGGPGITDQGLVHLAHLHRLERLTLQYCAIIDNSPRPSSPPKAASNAASRGAPVDPRAIWQTFEGIVAPTTVDFIDTPLNDAFGYFQDLHRIKIHVDPRTLKDGQDYLDSQVTYATSRAPLGSVLHAILQPQGLDWITGKEGLVITTKDRAAGATTAKITGTGFEHLKGLRQLQVLVLRLPHFTGTGLEHLAALTQLRELDLRGTQVTDGGLEHLKDWIGLQELDASGTEITNAGLEHLKGLTQLESLRLGGTRITDQGLEHLEGLNNLRALDLSDTCVTDHGLQHLRRLPHLQRLTLANIQVTDGGLKHLTKLAKLQRLVLISGTITDAGLEHLRGMTQLQTLVLHGNQITRQGRQKLQQALPKCRIN